MLAALATMMPAHISLLANEKTTRISLHWSCPGLFQKGERETLKFPEDQTIPISWTKVGSFDLAALDQFLSKVKASGIDAESCIRSLSSEIYRKLTAADDTPWSCKQFDKKKNEIEYNQCGVNWQNVGKFQTDLSTAKGFHRSETKARSRFSILGDAPVPLDQLIEVSTPTEGTHCWVNVNSAGTQAFIGKANSDDPKAEEPIDVPDIESLLLSREFIEEKLPALERAARPECKGFYISKVITVLSNTIAAEKFAGNHAVDPNVAKIADALQRLAQESDQTHDSTFLDESQFTCRTATPDGARNLLLELGEVISASRCARLPVGEAANIGLPGGPPYSSVPANYRLKRTDESHFDIEVPVHFRPESDQQAMTAKANECLKKVAPLMKGAGGKTMQIQLVSSSQPPTKMNQIDSFDPLVCAKVQSVIDKFDSGHPIWSIEEFPKEIQDELKPLLTEEQDYRFYVDKDCARENSGSWKTSTDCSIMTHETLHLLGLADEYPETALGYVIDPVTKRAREIKTLKEKQGVTLDRVSYDCRQVTFAGSIMSNQTTTFALARMDPTTGGPLTDPNTLKQLEEAKLKPRSTILYPGQFETLIHPGCRAESGDYYECAQLTHASSFEFDPKTETIKNTPEACGSNELRQRCASLAWLFSESGSAK